MATFKTRHYSFEYDPAGVQSVKISNREGKYFYVMARELAAFMRFTEREKKIQELLELQRKESET